jgi:hypothetical protein
VLDGMSAKQVLVLLQDRTKLAEVLGFSEEHAAVLWDAHYDAITHSRHAHRRVVVPVHHWELGLLAVRTLVAELMSDLLLLDQLLVVLVLHVVLDLLQGWLESESLLEVVERCILEPAVAHKVV